MLHLFTLESGSEGHLSWYAATCMARHSYRLPHVARRTASTWQGAACQCRRRALGLPRGVVAAGDDMKDTSSSVADDVVLLLGSSVVDNVLGVLSFFSHSLMFIVVTSNVLLFFRSYFEWPPCLLLSQSHSGRLPISWLVFLLSIESLSR